MGFKLPQHLRDSLSRRFSKTEFDKRGFGKNWFSPTLDRSERFKPLIAAMGYTPFQRRLREDAKTYFLYDRGPAKNFIHNHNLIDLYNNLERDMPIYEKNQTTYGKTKNTLKTFNIDVLKFELITNHGVRILAVPTDELGNLADNTQFVISCHDASLLAVKTDAIKSSLNQHFTLVNFNLITLRECTDWEPVVLD